MICDQLRNAAERHNLTYGPDPATHEYCTFGGMLGNNSCGTHSLMAGKTSDNVLELEVLLYDGTRLTVGATTDEQLTENHRHGRQKGPDLHGSQRPQGPGRRSRPRRVPGHPAPRVRL